MGQRAITVINDDIDIDRYHRPPQIGSPYQNETGVNLSKYRSSKSMGAIKINVEV